MFDFIYLFLIKILHMWHPTHSSEVHINVELVKIVIGSKLQKWLYLVGLFVIVYVMGSKFQLSILKRSKL